MTFTRRARSVPLAAALATIALATITTAAGPACAAPPSVAFYYAADPPWDELAAFDRVVVEPAHTPKPPVLAAAATEIFAYVALGEMQPGRPYAADLPPEWRRGDNTVWGSWRIDQTQPEWPRFFVQRIVRPLWEAGYSAFFLDVLDAYHAFTSTPEERAAQEAGMVRAIRLLKAEYPQARLMINRGFEILPEIHRDVIAVAAESLYRGWNPAGNDYREVSAADREFVLAALVRARDQFGLTAIAIDYVAPGARALARETAARISAHGIVPWVAEHTLGELGVGALEVMPRKILALHDSGRDRLGLAEQPIARFAAMPLQHLGYVPEYRDFTVRGLPAGILAGRYAAIVTWLGQESPEYEQTLAPFLARAVREGVRVIALGTFGLAPGPALDAMLPLASRPRPDVPQDVRITRRDSMVGLETEPIADRRSFHPLAARNARALVALADAQGATMDAVAVGDWGGYALAPYHVLMLPGGNGARWVIDPIAFFHEALGRPDHPIPDLTTVVGRRALLVQADAAGSTRAAEPQATDAKATTGGSERTAVVRDLAPVRAGDALVREIFAAHRVPITLHGSGVDARLPGHVRRGTALPLATGTITRAEPSLTMVPAPIQPRDPGDIAIFPAADDAWLTRDWSGASFGYERAIESFQMTERPRRLTPLAIAFSAHSAARRASLGALQRVFDHALASAPHPIDVAEYVARVHDFQHLVIARTADGWLVRGPARARTLRAASSFDPAASEGLAGANGPYLHVIGETARLRPGDAGGPYLVEANGAISAYERAAGRLRIELSANLPLDFRVAHAERCVVSSERGVVAPIADTRFAHFQFPPNATSDGDRRATIHCRG